ncbi:hypothetical protein FOL47_010912 [Perkinsus chesapeaki]|uniref:Peptidase C1A papain C-terminal domain-containing protein n=1 Tax=Perkinsus chesapeaki TaxID=330153 RepID=A0A7J6KZR5_PERCH|nr:hypothetical protein FOL47_010912 [Perkinsus chesapeaki]
MTIVLLWLHLVSGIFVDDLNSVKLAFDDLKSRKGITIRDAKRLCGTITDKTETLERKDYSEEDLQGLPDSFDARAGFAECKDVIGHVRDQSKCNGCWAFSVLQAFNDRVCIKSNGKHKALLSPGNMIACCDKAHGCAKSFGCHEGSPKDAWKWLNTTGVVSGGDYVKEDETTEADGCWPYNFPKCAHHIVSLKYPACGKEPLPTPKCDRSCPNKKYPTPSDKDRFYTSELDPVTFGSVDSIKKEIITNGPVSAVVVVYEDFLAYKSGVYKHTSGARLGPSHSANIARRSSVGVTRTVKITG